jgi:WD40 repeat protein
MPLVGSLGEIVGRTERPLDDGDSPVLQFAADLRRLRDGAGRLSYRELSRRGHYSAAAFSEAAAGRRLPSLPVTLAYVRACGGDAQEWEGRWHAVAAELAATVSVDSPDQDDAKAPYVGLGVFESEHAGRFFGRDRLVAQLADRVARQRFVAVLGPSGSGKSSVLRAGLLHRAASEGLPGMASVRTLLMTPGPHPLDTCAVQLAAILGRTADQVHAALLADPRGLHLLALQALMDQPADKDLLIVVDQFEEVFTLCRDVAERVQFLRLLAAAARAANSRVRIVLGVRADFYAHCLHHPELIEALTESSVVVGPMTTEELRAVIRQPAIQDGCRVETVLVSQLVADTVGQAGILPLLSHALLETWRRRQGTTLTLAGYHAAGGIEQSIAVTADTVFATFSDGQRSWARQLFVRLVALGEGTEDTKRRLDRSEVDADDPAAAAVLERLAQARLITLGRNSVELSHEALIRAWPRLHGWLNEDREALRVHRSLTEAASTWHRLDHDPGVLFRGVRLMQASQWAATAAADRALSARERQFLQAGLAARDRDETAARRRTRRLRQLLALVTALLLVSTATTWYAQRARQSSNRERNAAIAAKVLLQANDLHDTNPDLAAQLVVAAYRLADTADARASLLNTFATPYVTLLNGHTDIVHDLAYSRDGRTLLSAGGDHTLRLWSVTDPVRPRPLATLTKPAASIDGPAGFINAAYSPDGRLIAATTGRGIVVWDVTDPAHPVHLSNIAGNGALLAGVAIGADGILTASGGDRRGLRTIIRMWNITDPDQPRPIASPTGGAGPAVQLARSPDGHLLATIDQREPPTTDPLKYNDAVEARLWEVTGDGARVLDAPGRGFVGVEAVTFSPDGHRMVTADRHDLVKTWDVRDPRRPTALSAFPLGGNGIRTVAISPDGHTLAVANTGQGLRLWDITNPRKPQPLTQLAGAAAIVTDVTFSPDGNTLAAGSGLQIRLYDITGYAFSVRAHGASQVVAFGPDGHSVATGHLDGTVVIWDTADPYRPRPRATLAVGKRNDMVVALEFSPDHRILAAAGVTGPVKLWDTAAMKLVAEIPLDTSRSLDGSALTSMAYSPDGHTLAIGSLEAPVRLWDVTDPRQPRSESILTGFTGTANSVAFNADGRLLAVAGRDTNSGIWDVTDPQHPGKTANLPGLAPGLVTSIVFGHNSRTLAAGGLDGVRLWNVSPDGVARPVTTLGGHPSAELAPSSNGTLAVGDRDNTVTFWDITNSARPQPPVRFIADGRAYSVAFSPDGQLFAVAGADTAIAGQAIRLRQTNPDDLAARICALAQLTITRAEWNQYFLNLPYHPPCS